VLIRISVQLPKQCQLLLLQLLLNESVVLHRTRHTPELEFLNPSDQGQKVSAAGAWLPTTILAMSVTLSCRKLFRFW
jgi:hypothetical protein